jgi:hypothetical protein
MGKRPWVRFYHMDFASSGYVLDLTMEELGVYWMLLVRQMVDGYVKFDRHKLKRILNVETEEDVDRLLTEKIKSKFVQDRKNPDQWYNERLSEVIDETDSASRNGSANINSRYVKLNLHALEKTAAATPASAPEVPAEEQAFDFDAILDEYPKTKNKGGREKSLELLRDTITTEDLFNSFCAALRAFRKAKAGEDPQFVMRIDKWIQEWREWVPADARQAPVKPEASSPGEKKRRVLGPGEKPPWEPARYDTPDRIEEKKRIWPLERQELWWNQEDTSMGMSLEDIMAGNFQKKESN